METIKITGKSLGSDNALQRLRSGLTDCGQMHAEIATGASQFVRDYLIATAPGRHRSAEMLGAVPTGFRATSANSVTSDSNDEMALVLMPRNTGLGRAFHDVVITPTRGSTYLTIPAHPLTYGRPLRDFPEDTFKFAILHAHRPFPVLMFRAGPEKGKVAYWLRRSVDQKQDRSLLPSDDALREVGRRAAVIYLTRIVSSAA